MRRRVKWTRRRRATLAGLSLAGLSFLSAGLGWWNPEQAWPVATGWQQIAPAERPAPGPLWADDPADPPPRLIWLGHAGFALRWQGTQLLLDPNTNRRCSLARRVLQAASLEDLGPIDAALISHAHFDHLDPKTLASVPGGLPALLLPAGSEVYLPPHLAARAIPMRVGEATRIGALEVTAVVARHNGNRFHPLASRKLALGYVIRAAGSAIYFAGDTGFGDHFAEIRRVHHPRAAILPIGAFQPRFPLRRYHLSPEEAVLAAEALAVKMVVPAHFGTFRLSFDRPASALPRFARAARAAGLAWRMPRLPGVNRAPRLENKNP